MDENAIVAVREWVLANGWSELDLDEVVYEVANERASVKVNHGADYDAQHDNADGLAAAVNNGGLDDQVRFLVADLGEDGAREMIAHLA